MWRMDLSYSCKIKLLTKLPRLIKSEYTQALLLNLEDLAPQQQLAMLLFLQLPIRPVSSIQGHP
jgi:hypothetical protein